MGACVGECVEGWERVVVVVVVCGGGGTCSKVAKQHCSVLPKSPGSGAKMSELKSRLHHLLAGPSSARYLRPIVCYSFLIQNTDVIRDLSSTSCSED